MTKDSNTESKTAASQTVKGFSVGSKAAFTHQITQEDVKRFVELTGDDNPVHVDKDFAKTTRMKDVVAHGMLSASFISTMIGKHIPGSGALWMSQSLEFLLPVRVGDTLTINAEVTAVHVSQRMLELSTNIANQFGERVLQGSSKVQVLEQEKPAEVVKAQAENAIVLITGGSRGIGAAIAEELGSKNTTVIINYSQDKHGAEEVAAKINSKGGKAITYACDITDAHAVRGMVDAVVSRCGGLSGIVHNACGRLAYIGLEELTDAEIDRHMKVNVNALISLTQAALPHLVQSGRGSVVTIGTIAADGVPAAKMLSYIAAKSAAMSLTKCLAAELGPKGVRFNIVAPGPTDTAMIAQMPERARLTTKMQTPLRKFGAPQDVAHSVSFLMSDEARHITGATLRVCGGLSME